MKRLVILLIGTVLLSCNKHETSVTGHWHEYVNDSLTHCYRITDNFISVDELSIGYTTELIEEDNKRTLMSVTGFYWTNNYTINGDRLEINDSTTWIKVQDNTETFKKDLSIGLLVDIEPIDLGQIKYDLNYDSATEIIYVGQLKGKSDSTYQIQLNDVIGKIEDIKDYLSSYHRDNHKRIAVINADKDVPNELIQTIIDEILKSGYAKKNVFRTAIDSKNLSIGLVRVE